MNNNDHFTQPPPQEREPSYYETGCTHPLKSRGGIIAVLLAVVIFFGGMLNALSLMNIRLSWMDSPDAVATPVSFCSDPLDALLAKEASAGYMGQLLGICGQDITVTDQLFYRLPQGVYITQAAAGSHGFCQGLRIGDVLTEFNGSRINSLSQLEQLLSDAGAGDTVELCIYRNGSRQTIRVTMDAIP